FPHAPVPPYPPSPPAGPDMAAEVLAPLQPAGRGLVLLPVNDNPDAGQAAGGSHWSLLVFHRPSNTLRHYDSSAGCNTRPARQLASAIGPALAGGSGQAAAAGPDPALGPAPALPRYVEVAGVPQQSNGYDCGAYVLALADAVCEWWQEQHQTQRQQLEALGEGRAAAAAAEGWERRERALRGWLTPACVAGVRSEVLRIIRAKAAGRSRKGVAPRVAVRGA
ncbi:NEDD8-specific protease 1, partial [Tetrabaena socialis]